MTQYMCYLYYFSKVQEIYYMLVMVEKKKQEKKREFVGFHNQNIHDRGILLISE